MDEKQLLVLLIIMVGVLTLAVAVLAALTLRRRGKNDLSGQVEELRREMEEQQRLLRQELSETTQSSMRALGELVGQNQAAMNQMQGRQMDRMNENLMEKQMAAQQSITSQLAQLERRFATFTLGSEQKLEAIRGAVEQRLTLLQQDNNHKLDQMRQVVDEKLQQSLEEKMTRSFALVSERLEQVYKGLGEMQTLASGVGDLKKVLSNVKTRGILGEIQLGAILEEILAPEQYETNVATKPGSRNVVEYAVKLPTEDGTPVYLPIDSKFPADAYMDLREAYDNGDPQKIHAAAAILQNRLRAFAKDIRDKYIDPPHTTDFAILFLPFEGLYSEAVNRGMVEILQREFHVNIAGPSTMAALLNSLQMGFRTFAIQKRSSEVWNVLGAVKTEFDKFAGALQATQQRLEQAGDELDKLVGVRTRQIQRRLKNVTALPDQTATVLLAEDDGDEEP